MLVFSNFKPSIFKNMRKNSGIGWALVVFIAWITMLGAMVLLIKFIPDP